jgi:hypothetical protein
MRGEDPQHLGNNIRLCPRQGPKSAIRFGHAPTMTHLLSLCQRSTMFFLVAHGWSRQGSSKRRQTGAYRAEDLVGMQDFNVTWEWFGEFWPEKKPRHAKRPSPHTLVTPKVMNIFRDAGVTTFHWIPVLLEE